MNRHQLTLRSQEGLRLDLGPAAGGRSLLGLLGNPSAGGQRAAQTGGASGN